MLANQTHRASDTPTVIDLFAGAGGLSLGLYQAGWESLFAIEKNAFASVFLDAKHIILASKMV